MKCIVKVLSAVVLVCAAMGWSSSAHAVACASTDEGKMQYDKTTKNMEYCDGTKWKILGALGTGTSCHWEFWGAKGQGGNGKAALYPAPLNPPQSPQSGAYCDIGDYVAAVVGDGITTGGKIDFGHVLCCPVTG